VHEWADLDPRELPDPALLAGHAVPSLNSPDVMEDLANSVGKGEQVLQRPPNNNNNMSPFVSAYRRVFDAHRGVFGSGSGGGGVSGHSPSSSPRFERRPLAAAPQINRDMHSSNKQLDTVAKGGGVISDTPVRPSRALLGGPPIKTTVKSGVIGQAFKVSPAAAGFLQPAAATNAPSVIAATGSPKSDERKRDEPVILPRHATDKFREPLKKVSIDPKMAPVSHKSAEAVAASSISSSHPLALPRQPFGPPSRSGELLRTPSGLPDLIPSAVTVRSLLTGREPDISRGTAESTPALWMRPTDVLRTPYLTEPARASEAAGALTPAGRPLTVSGVSEMGPRFPQIAGNSVVAKGSLRKKKSGHETSRG